MHPPNVEFTATLARLGGDDAFIAHGQVVRLAWIGARLKTSRLQTHYHFTLNILCLEERNQQLLSVKGKRVR